MHRRPKIQSLYSRAAITCGNITHLLPCGFTPPEDQGIRTHDCVHANGQVISLNNSTCLTGLGLAKRGLDPANAQPLMDCTGQANHQTCFGTRFTRNMSRRLSQGLKFYSGRSRPKVAFAGRVSSVSVLEARWRRLPLQLIVQVPWSTSEDRAPCALQESLPTPISRTASTVTWAASV